MISTAVADHTAVVKSPSAPEVPACRGGLSTQEEHDLAARIADGDREARNLLVLANLGLVGTIARGFLGRGLPYEDLVAEGSLGLMRGAEEFDPRFGTRFSTYAAYWIREAIRRALMNTTSTIRLPVHMVGLLTRWRRAERALRREAGRAPSFDEIASSLQLSEAQQTLVSRALNARRLRLESSYGAGASEHLFSEITDRHGSADEPAEAEEDRCAVWRLMGQLDARERAILTLRYGLEGELPLTLKEIGRRLGVTREWVRKLEVRALRKLAEWQRYGGDSPSPAIGPTPGGRDPECVGSRLTFGAISSRPGGPGSHRPSPPARR
jgi:RNA polymerase primary sigma factor